eukprot:13546599-Heterocapsa_arctica.AAC.1
MVIARMPEDTFKNLQEPSKTCKAIYTCMCTPVGPAESYIILYMKAEAISDPGHPSHRVAIRLRRLADN